jgi:hypothetical protein
MLSGHFMALKLVIAQFRRWIVKRFDSSQQSTLEPLVTACHFFGDHSPFGFWDDQQLDRVPELLQVIKKDGFNTIILVVPYEPFVERQPRIGLNIWYWDRLGVILGMAEDANLSVILRLGYPHSTSPDNQTYLVDRQMEMLDEERTRRWLAAFFEKAAEVVSKSPAYAGAFLAWEDFWIVFDHPPNLPEEERVKVAAKVGLAGLAAKWVNDDQLCKMVGADPANWPTAIVPLPNTPAYVLWMRWFDHFLFNFVGDCAKQFFPDIAFEIRSDGHPITVGGKTVWASFELLRGAPQRRYGYWGAYYGANNAGELLTAREAMRGLEYSLDVTNGTGKYANIVLEQFNIVDNTLAFSGTHARIEPNELPNFLTLAAPVIASRTSGYGLWTYRNYRENWLANSTFQRGLDGWDTTGSVEIMRSGSRTKQSIAMPAKCGIAQSIRGMLRLQASLSQYPSFKVLLRITDGEGNAVTHKAVLVKVGDINAVAAGSDEGRLRFAVPKEAVTEGIFEFSIRNESRSTLEVSDICFYAYEQLGGLYDANRQELPLARSIRKFNADLTNASTNLRIAACAE